MISSIIFSKDRALQLDLLLNSIYRNFPETLNDVKVIWTASSDRFETGYQQLQSEHPNISFKKQGLHFFYDLYETICVSNNPFICMFTDDDIIYRKVKFNDHAINLLNNQSIICYSLRLGQNTLFRDINGIESQEILPSQVYMNNEFILWNRHSIPPGGYWAYPFSVDGHIFRKNDIMFVSEMIMHWAKLEKCQENPNELESKMQRFNCDFGAMMMCDTISSIVNTPNNRVQNLFQNRSGDEFPFSQDHCNNLYLSGSRINIDKLDFSNINKPHKELDIFSAI